jgi:hypothetical protein
VKNPSCERVDVDYRYDTNLQPILDSFGNKVLRIKIPTESENLSQIIIPKEVAKKLHEMPLAVNSVTMSCASKPKQETLEEVAERIAENFKNVDFKAGVIYGIIEGAKWQQEQDKNKFSGEDVPNNLESVLAKITHQNDLGLSQWHEVVYYDNETEKWCCYSGSKTFQDGERVVDWKYCKDLL